MSSKQERHCFVLKVDKKEYGPFLAKEKEKFKNLVGRCGVEFVDVWIKSGWVVRPKRKVNSRDKSLPLLEGVDF